MPSTATDRLSGLTYHNGERFGMLVVEGAAPSVLDGRGKSRRMLSVIFDCGSRSVVRLSNLRSGNTGSCGCQKRVAAERWRAELAVLNATEAGRAINVN